MIKLISHHYCPDDQYTKEVAILELPLKDGSAMRFVYTRKEIKTGGMFWGPLICSVMIDGQKQHFKATLFDSTFLEQDIKEFLNARSWERRVSVPPASFENYVSPPTQVPPGPQSYAPAQPDLFDPGEPPF